jgi:adenosylmethionine-8-amino-7-oxononanoate aminotransferase
MFVQSGSGNVDGKIGDMILFGPAFIVSKDEIDEIIRIFDISIGAVEQRIGVE